MEAAPSPPLPRPWAAAAASAAVVLAAAALLLPEGASPAGLAAAALVTLAPGALLAPRRRGRGHFRGRVSDFLLVAPVGLLTLHVYFLAVTGRPSWFYLWLLRDSAAHEWAGSEGLTPNLGLFVPAGLAMAAAMCVARVGVGVLRNVCFRGSVYAGAAAVAFALAWLQPPGVGPPTAGPPAEGWERALPVVGGAEPSAAAPCDTVLVVMESLRADALHPETMPHAWALAGRGLVLAEHHAGANSSVLGMYGLLTGKPAAHAAADLAADDPRPPGLLGAAKRAGHRTEWFCGNGSTDGGAFGRLVGPGRFDRRHTRAHADWAEGDAWALGRLAEALAEPDRPPVFAVVFLVATHFDYPPPGEADRRFEPSAPDAALLVPWPEGGAGRRSVLNRYRNAAYAADARLGRFLAGVDLSTTRVAVTGDHGQSLGEDGTIGHWSRLSDAQTRVPFVLAGPGVPAGRVGVTTAHADAAALLLRVMRGLPVDPDPPPRPTLLVQSNPVGGTEDWVVLDRGARTGWRRSGGVFRLLGPVDALGRVR